MPGGWGGVFDAPGKPRPAPRSVLGAVPVTFFEPKIQAARRVAAHASLTTAAGTVSARVLIFTEGVIHAMTLHTLKLLAIPCVVAAFVTTGAGVMAYQFGGTTSGPGPAEKKAQPPAEKAAAKLQTPANPAPTGLTERQIDQEFEGHLFRLASGDPNPNTVSAAITFSINQRHANANLGTTPDRASEARNGHLDRMERLVQAIKESKLDAGTKEKALARARFAVTEAAKAVDPTRNPFGPETAGG